MGRREVKIALRDLDIISEDLIVSNLEGRNPRSFSLLSLQLENPALPFPGNFPQTVQLLIIMRFNDSSLFEGEGWIFNNGGLQEPGQILKGLQARLPAL